MVPVEDYTVLYTTTPISRQAVRVTEPAGDYSMHSEVQELLHIEMKRDLSTRAKIVGNQTIIDGPLFEKYQFLTPGKPSCGPSFKPWTDQCATGIYMGFLVGFLLLSILYVGLSALSSLSVTYAAFDKEQGQLAKTKAQ
jgi:hypothetical protein